MNEVSTSWSFKLHFTTSLKVILPLSAKSLPFSDMILYIKMSMLNNITSPKRVIRR